MTDLAELIAREAHEQNSDVRWGVSVESDGYVVVWDNFPRAGRSEVFDRLTQEFPVIAMAAWPQETRHTLAYVFEGYDSPELLAAWKAIRTDVYDRNMKSRYDLISDSTYEEPAS